jgi:hypothetical protein
MRCRVSGRTSVGICRAYKCRYLDRDRYLRHEGHIAPQPSSATSPHVVARLALSWPSAIHRLLIHQHTPRNQPASASKQTLPSLFRSAVCLLFVCHASSTSPSLPSLPSLSANHKPRPNLGLSPHRPGRLTLHPCPHILILLSTHIPSQNI